MRVELRAEARADLDEGAAFYEDQRDGLGDYFVDSLFSDLEALQSEGGIHERVFGLHRKLSARFPFAIYYRVEGATVHRSVQSPRPPITIAAMGPRMMRYAATYADTWNTMSFLAGFEDQLAEVVERMSRMAGYCEAVGRDPETLRRSYLMFDAKARQSGGHISYYDSPQAFADMADRLFDLGFTELGLYYPALSSQRLVFETIANDVIPTLRESRKPSR